MPAFNFSCQLWRMLKIVLIMLLSSGLLIWLNQSSLDRFWQQKYHRPVPWQVLSAYSAWQMGGIWHDKIVAVTMAAGADGLALLPWHHVATAALPLVSATGSASIPANKVAASQPDIVNSPSLPAVSDNKEPTVIAASIAVINSNNIKTPVALAENTQSVNTQLTEQQEITESAVTEKKPEQQNRQQQNRQQQDRQLTIAAENPHQPIPAMPDGSVSANANSASASAPVAIAAKPRILLQPGDQVLLAGDSMMQGVAPHLKRLLLTHYQINSLDLSKQNTGLAYPGFFNWPQTIADCFAQDDNIRLLIIFLGPNDPWDMPGDTGERHYLKFASERWEQLYRSRVREILQIAHQYHASVIWLGPPNMRKSKLSRSIKYLDSLYQAETSQAGEIYLPVNAMFKYQGDIYSDYFGDNSSQRKLRAGDGVHFSPTGQKVIAEQVFSFIHFSGSATDPNS